MPRHGGVKSITTDMMHVYILQSEKDNGFYVGCSNNHVRRLEEHNKGENLSTKSRRPWRLVHVETFAEPKEAYAREKTIKSYKGGNGLKKLLNL